MKPTPEPLTERQLLTIAMLERHIEQTVELVAGPTNTDRPNWLLDVQAQDGRLFRCSDMWAMPLPEDGAYSRLS